MKTVVGLYNSLSEANKVRGLLTSEGYDSSDITVIDQNSDSSNTTDSGYSTTDSEHNTIPAKIKNFFGSLIGHDEESHRSYSEHVGSGGTLLAVTVEDEDAEEIADLLYAQGAREVQGSSGNAGYAGTTGSGYGNASGTGAQDGAVLEGNTGRGTTTGASGERVIPVVAEELEVGKREVQRGGVRIYSRVVSEPVSESVRLHDERVVVDRRSADRPATEADFNTGAGVVEVTATGEEAVVGKRSRVVEEVLVGKEATDRTEQINETVRHTEVEVEPATTGKSTSVGTGRSTTGNTDFDR